MSNSRPVERAADAAGVVFIAIVTALMADRLVAWFQQLVDFWHHQGGVVSAVLRASGGGLEGRASDGGRSSAPVHFMRFMTCLPGHLDAFVRRLASISTWGGT